MLILIVLIGIIFGAVGINYGEYTHPSISSAKPFDGIGVLHLNIPPNSNRVIFQIQDGLGIMGRIKLF